MKIEFKIETNLTSTKERMGRFITFEEEIDGIKLGGWDTVLRTEEDVASNIKNGMLSYNTLYETLVELVRQSNGYKSYIDKMKKTMGKAFDYVFLNAIGAPGKLIEVKVAGFRLVTNGIVFLVEKEDNKRGYSDSHGFDFFEGL